jgi:transglutaminase-like putative cysteine protease
VNLHRWLQLHTALLAVLGASFLLLTGDNSVFPYALGGSALIALVITDWFGWIKVPRIVGNVAAIVSVAWTFREFSILAKREDQLLAISHMLIYLQVVLVFQEKSRRVHWQLLVLSVLQVVVAAALSLGPQFGLLLVIYLATAIACMMLLCYERELPEADVDPRPQKSPTSFHRLLDPPQQRISERQQEQFVRWINGKWLARSVSLFTLGSIALATVFFFTAPRLNEALWQTGRVRHSQSGFSGEVVLKPRGRIRLSDQPVMRVSFRRPGTQRAVLLASEPYFHGRVLTTYAPLDSTGQWFFRSIYGDEKTIRYRPVEPADPEDVVRQDIRMEGSRSDYLFAMMPVIRLPETPQWIHERRHSPRLSAKDDPLHPNRELSFSIGTLAIRNGRQLAAVPHFNPHETDYEIQLLWQERYDLQQFDENRFPGIKQLADKIIREQNLHGEPALVRALALRNYLRDSGEFQYSLEMDDSDLTDEQRQLDPVEQFVVYHKQGHCEYFASALVLMLRSQGIPARMVIGYKGGDWNSIGQYYLVRQKHAHAWVEIHLRADEVPLEELAGKPSSSGAWYRLDPTPASISPEDEQAKVADVFDYLDYVWRDYVVGLNSSRQEDVLDPLTGGARHMFAARDLDPAQLRKWLKRRVFGEEQTAANPKRPEADRAEGAVTLGVAVCAVIVLVMVLPVVVMASVVGLRRLVARWLAAAECKRNQSALLTSFRQALARQGIPLSPQATVQETAEVAAAQLTLPTDRLPLTAILRTIVSGYHRVRFGGSPLNPSEQAEVEAALAELQKAHRTSPSGATHAQAQ